MSDRLNLSYGTDHVSAWRQVNSGGTFTGGLGINSTNPAFVLDIVNVADSDDWHYTRFARQFADTNYYLRQVTIGGALDWVHSKTGPPTKTVLMRLLKTLTVQMPVHLVIGDVVDVATYIPIGTMNIRQASVENDSGIIWGIESGTSWNLRKDAEDNMTWAINIASGYFDVIKFGSPANVITPPSGTEDIGGIGINMLPVNVLSVCQKGVTNKEQCISQQYDIASLRSWRTQVDAADKYTFYHFFNTGSVKTDIMSFTRATDDTAIHNNLTVGGTVAAASPLHIQQSSDDNVGGVTLDNVAAGDQKYAIFINASDELEFYNLTAGGTPGIYMRLKVNGDVVAAGAKMFEIPCEDIPGLVAAHPNRAGTVMRHIAVESSCGRQVTYNFEADCQTIAGEDYCALITLPDYFPFIVDISTVRFQTQATDKFARTYAQLTLSNSTVEVFMQGAPGGVYVTIWAERVQDVHYARTVAADGKMVTFADPYYNNPAF